MTVATTTQFYVTVAEANDFLKLKDSWIDLSTEEKEDALLWGRYFIDTNFDCVIDMDAISEEVKYANALLAYDYHVQGDLFFVNEEKVKQKHVIAGKVESEKTFFHSSGTRPNSYSKVVAILKTVCNKISGQLTRV